MGADRFTRHWAFPSAETFSIPPIKDFVKKYLRQSSISVDPFARDCEWATYTNDLNHKTNAEYHLDSRDFLREMIRKEVRADLVIFDPPYSPRQVKECYDGIGLKMEMESAWRTQQWAVEKGMINKIMTVGGVFLHFGWNSTGIGKRHGYELLEILLVCHGSGHNDTICMAERKVAHQHTLI